MLWHIMKSRLKTSHIALLATCRDRRAHQLLLWFLKQNAPSVIPAIFIALHRFCYTLYMKVRKVFFLQNFAMQCLVMRPQQFDDCQILVKPLCSRIRIYILADNITCLFLTLSRPRTNLDVMFHPGPKKDCYPDSDVNDMLGNKNDLPMMLMLMLMLVLM